MPKAALLRGAQTVVWGTSQVGGSGKVQSGDRGNESDMVEIPDGEGSTSTAVFFNFNNPTQFEAYCEPTSALPESGDPITVCGIDCLVISAKWMWMNKDCKKLQCTAKRFAFQRA